MVVLSQTELHPRQTNTIALIQFVALHPVLLQWRSKWKRWQRKDVATIQLFQTILLPRGILPDAAHFFRCRQISFCVAGEKRPRLKRSTAKRVFPTKPRQ